MTNVLGRWGEKRGGDLILQSIPCVKRTNQGQLTEHTYQLLLSFCAKWPVEVRRKPVCSCVAVYLLLKPLHKEAKSGFCR